MSSMRKKLILVGSGMAGSRFLDHILQLAPEKYDIRVFNKEPVGGYNRIMLSPVLAGEKNVNDIITHDASWFSQNGIQLHTGTLISEINREKKYVVTDLGNRFEYDTLIIATGSKPFMLPVKGADLNGVVSFRDIRDVNRMLETARTAQKAVVIGGGLLGLEAAYGLQKRGMKVTVLHRGDVLMNMQMDAEAGALLKASLEAKGMRFEMDANTTEIIGDEVVERLRFENSDGASHEIKTQLVVMAVGIRPNTKLAKEMGLEVNRGVVVNDQMETSQAGIFALGECVEHRGQTYGLVAPLYEQAEVLAKTLAQKTAVYEGTLTSTMLKVTGINLFSAGDFQGNDETEALVYRDSAKQVYRKVVLKGNHIVGSVMFGDTTDGNWIFDLLKQNEDVSSLRDTLIFGRGYA